MSKAYARAHADGRERTWPEGLRRSPPAARSNHLDPASRGVAAAQRLCASRHSKPEAALPCDGRVGASLEHAKRLVREGGCFRRVKRREPVTRRTGDLEGSD
mgnify:CR=1 FL=1